MRTKITIFEALLKASKDYTDLGEAGFLEKHNIQEECPDLMMALVSIYKKEFVKKDDKKAVDKWLKIIEDLHLEINQHIIKKEIKNKTLYKLFEQYKDYIFLIHKSLEELIAKTKIFTLTEKDVDTAELMLASLTKKEMDDLLAHPGDEKISHKYFLKAFARLHTKKGVKEKALERIKRMKGMMWNLENK